MSNYNQNRSGGGDYRRRDSGRREMHRAVCDECGQNCEVPFRPSGDKPIYCSNCFENRGGGNSNRSNRSSERRSGGSSYGKPDNTNKQLLDQVSSLNKKLDRILVVLESGTGKTEKIEPKKVEKMEVKVEVKEEPKEEKKEVKKVVKKTTSEKESKKTKKAVKKATPEVK
jgi:CxxC-x17-CxxC domain-containing protein